MQGLPAFLRRSVSDSGRTVSAILVLVLTAANGVWIFFDNATPSWDQSHYLDVAWQYRQALNRHGIHGLAHTLYFVDPSHAPLYSLLLLPFLYVFGDGPRSALFLDLALTPVFLATTGLISLELFSNRRAQQLTIVAAGTMPLLVGLSHEILQDFLLLTLTTIAVWLMLRSNFFNKRPTMALLGVTIGLGMLTKVTYVIFIVGPMIVIAIGRGIIWFSRSERRRSSGRRFKTFFIDILVAAIPALVISATWYMPQFKATLNYVRSTTSGPLAAGAGPANPLTPRDIASFTYRHAQLERVLGDSTCPTYRGSLLRADVCSLSSKKHGQVGSDSLGGELPCELVRDPLPVGGPQP